MLENFSGAILIRSNLDCPKGYVCRYVKEGPYEIYADVDQFNKTLDALVTIIYAKVKSHPHVVLSDGLSKD